MKLSARVGEEEAVDMEVEVAEEEVSLSMGGGRGMLMVEEVMVVEAVTVVVALEEVALEEVALEGVAVAILLLQVEEEGVEVATLPHQEATQHPPAVAEVAIPPPWGGGSLFPPLEVTTIPILIGILTVCSHSTHIYLTYSCLTFRWRRWWLLWWRWWRR